MKIPSSFSPLVCLFFLTALMPSACGDSDEQGDGGSGKGGGDEGGNDQGGSDAGGTGARGGTGGSAAVGGTSGAAGTGGTSGAGGTSGEGGEGGVGASGGEAGASGGEAGSGAGGAPTCPFRTDDTVSGTLKITTDDNFRLYVNGTLIDETPRLWFSPQTYMVNVFRHPSRKNVIAVEGINNAEIDGLDRGIVLDLSFDAGAGPQSVLSDTTWKLSTMLETNWFEVAFVDTAWVAATDEGAHGIMPYGNILGTSSARWLWSYDANISAASKPTTETIWIRKTFYVNGSGLVSTAGSACP